METMTQENKKLRLKAFLTKKENLSSLARDVVGCGIGYSERQRAELWESSMNEVIRCLATADQAVFLRTLLEVFGQEIIAQQKLLKRAPKGVGRNFGVTADQANQMG
jgi:hypothetical protein